MYWKIIFVLSLSKLRPAAVLALHGKHPFNRALHRIVLVALARMVDIAQRQANLRRVVDIGIKLIVELEVPAARLALRNLHRPVALVVTSFDNSQSAAFSMRGSLRDTPASPSAKIACAVSHTGEIHGCIRNGARFLRFNAQLFEFVHARE